MANYTKDEQLALIRSGKFGYENLKEIDNQYEEVCLEAVSNNGWAIEYIKNPTEEMKLKAIKHSGLTIQYIKNPTEEMKLEAVKNDGYALKYMDNASDEVMLEAIKKDGLLISHIYNPTDEMKLEAIKSDGRSIKYIKNPTDEMKLLAIKNSEYAIRYIKNPTQEMKLAAVKKSGTVVKYIEDVNNEVCFNALLNILEPFGDIEVDYENFKIKNCTLFVTERYLKYYFEDYEICVPIINISVFNKLKEYLLYFNAENCFMFDYTVDLKTLKEVAITNNELLYITYSEVEEVPIIYKSLVNEVMDKIVLCIARDNTI